MEKNGYKVAKIRKVLNFSFESGDAKRPGEVLREMTLTQFYTQLNYQRNVKLSTGRTEKAYLFCMNNEKSTRGCTSEKSGVNFIFICYF